MTLIWDYLEKSHWQPSFFASCCAMDKDHVAYLMQSKEVDAAITLYETYKKELGRP
jgi:hypothetical protein